MTTHIHLIGICGSGLSAIARLLLESGYVVSGSDRQMSPVGEALEASGARIFIGHRPENTAGANLVVRSSAIPDGNVEVQAALEAGIPVLKRTDFLGRLMEGRLGIAVAGSHGKTTTTAMIAWLLAASGQDPSFIIGGVSTNLGANARAGRGWPFVIEADEYDRMFLGLNPKIAVVTNVEHDHPDCYPTAEDFHQAFRDFSQRLAPRGVLVACCDDPGAARLLSESASDGLRTLSYGLGRWLGRPCPDYCAVNPRPNDRGGFDFDFVPGDQRPVTSDWAVPASDWQSAVCPERVRRVGGRRSMPVSLQIPGHHNVRNALASLAVADLLGLPLDEAAETLGQFQGTARRFELRGESGGVTVIDDYAHNPAKIRATLSAARARYPGREIWAVWQPHTYSRARLFLDDFAASFVDADHVLVTEVYASREADPGDFSARQVVQAMSHPDVIFTPGLEDAAAYLVERLRPGAVVLVLSAGDADWICGEVLQKLEKMKHEEHKKEIN
jgi:UDP-N-acetylmuramate--alanine ligase